MNADLGLSCSNHFKAVSSQPERENRMSIGDRGGHPRDAHRLMAPLPTLPPPSLSAKEIPYCSHCRLYRLASVARAQGDQPGKDLKGQALGAGVLGSGKVGREGEEGLRGLLASLVAVSRSRGLGFMRMMRLRSSRMSQARAQAAATDALTSLLSTSSASRCCISLAVVYDCGNLA